MANVVELEYKGTGDQLISESKKVSNSVDDVGNKSKKSGSAIASGFKAAAAGIAAAGVVGLLKGMVSEAEEAQKVSASTAQGIKTMGAASWITAKQVGDLSEAISNKIGVDDELIQSSANLLLTFGKVRNEVGKNNDIFNRAVRAAQDMAAKGFGDANSAAKMLGKALNDPLKGINAMSRAGVTFTEGQKKQIKTMVESGNILGAQKMIMREVERQVGGTAEATATATDKMKVKWANFQEELGTALMPVLEKVLGLLMDFVAWAMEHQGIVIAFAAITAAIWLMNAALNANPIVLIVTLIAGLVAALITLWNTNEDFRNSWTAVWNFIKKITMVVVNAIVAAWNWLWRAGVKVVNAIITAFWAVINFFKRLPGWIRNAIGVVVGIITWPFRKAAEIVGGIIRGIIGYINTAIADLRTLIGLANNPNFRSGSGIKPMKHHSGGVVSGMVGTEQLRVLQAGEKVTPVGQSSRPKVTFAGNLSDPLAIWIMKAINDRQILIPGVNT